MFYNSADNDNHSCTQGTVVEGDTTEIYLFSVVNQRVDETTEKQVT